MSINFAAASTAGLNNPGTEIITLVKDGSGSFITPPSYDKMRAYLSSGEVPMLFVTAEGGETGSLYQLVDYSETENKIRFSNDTTAIEFCAGAEKPVISDVGGGGGSSDAVLYTAQTLTKEQKKQARENIDAAGAFVINATLTSDNHSATLDKTLAQIQAAIQEGKYPVVHLADRGDSFIPLVSSTPVGVVFATVGAVGEGSITDISLMITDNANVFRMTASPAINSDGALIQFPMESDPVSPMQIAT